MFYFLDGATIAAFVSEVSSIYLNSLLYSFGTNSVSIAIRHMNKNAHRFFIIFKLEDI